MSRPRYGMAFPCGAAARPRSRHVRPANRRTSRRPAVRAHGVPGAGRDRRDRRCARDVGHSNGGGRRANGRVRTRRRRGRRGPAARRAASRGRHRQEFSYRTWWTAPHSTPRSGAPSDGLAYRTPGGSSPSPTRGRRASANRAAGWRSHWPDFPHLSCSDRCPWADRRRTPTSRGRRSARSASSTARSSTGGCSDPVRARATLCTPRSCGRTPSGRRTGMLCAGHGRIWTTSPIPQPGSVIAFVADALARKNGISHPGQTLCARARRWVR